MYDLKKNKKQKVVHFLVGILVGSTALVCSGATVEAAGEITFNIGDRSQFQKDGAIEVWNNPQLPNTTGLYVILNKLSAPRLAYSGVAQQNHTVRARVVQHQEQASQFGLPQQIPLGYVRAYPVSIEVNGDEVNPNQYLVLNVANLNNKAQLCPIDGEGVLIRSFMHNGRGVRNITKTQTVTLCPGFDVVLRFNNNSGHDHGNLPHGTTTVRAGEEY